MDMPIESSVPKFNWSMNLLIQLDSEEEFDLIFNNLKDGGNVMMGPEKFLNMRKCAWITDKCYMAVSLDIKCVGEKMMKFLKVEEVNKDIQYETSRIFVNGFYQ